MATDLRYGSSSIRQGGRIGDLSWIMGLDRANPALAIIRDLVILFVGIQASSFFVFPFCLFFFLSSFPFCLEREKRERDIECVLRHRGKGGEREEGQIPKVPIPGLC